MQTREQAESVLEALEGQQLDGKTIHLEKSKRGAPRPKTPGQYLGKRLDESHPLPVPPYYPREEYYRGPPPPPPPPSPFYDYYERRRYDDYYPPPPRSYYRKEDYYPPPPPPPRGERDYPSRFQ
eukprot:TRINITY_DN3710_c0_g1_i3.p1 TRINITY_DN3710_c0_g1~~TRINITY_DN3710_c0_g1_i3.p1  ORF type:complete len:124 (-),score=32.01 TRINITY_DN3710_c0_g1_i3:252-623(-)